MAWRYRVLHRALSVLVEHVVLEHSWKKKVHFNYFIDFPILILVLWLQNTRHWLTGKMNMPKQRPHSPSTLTDLAFHGRVRTSHWPHQALCTCLYQDHRPCVCRSALEARTRLRWLCAVFPSTQLLFNRRKIVVVLCTVHFRVKTCFKKRVPQRNYATSEE